MANRFWRNLGGGIANALVPGEVYNKYNGQWAPTGVLAGRVGAGVAGQLAGPAGSLAGMVANQYIGNTPEGMSFDGGIEFGEALSEDWNEVERGLSANLRTSVPMLSPNMLGPSMMPSVGGFATSAPQSGIPQQATSYGMSLPNFAQPQQQVAASGSSTGGGGQGGGGGMGGSGGGGLGMGNVALLGTTRRYGEIKRS